MSRLSTAILLGFLTGIVGLLISFLHLAHDVEEDAGLGLLFKLRGVKKAPPDVVIVSIDRESSEHLKVSTNPDKWPRSLHARLIESLAGQGAQVITLDLYFIEPGSAEDDKSFAEAIRKAHNVVLAEPLKAKSVSPSDVADPYMGEHKIVHIVKPIAPLSQSATATAPFVLPRLPVKVNQYWTFQTHAGDSPTFPVVALQLYALRIYGDFIGLLEKVSPPLSGKLPRDADDAIKTRGAVRLVRDIREIFENEPLISKKMAEELERSDLAKKDTKKYRLLKSLVRLYGGPNRQYLNYYGPPRTVKTVPFHQALRLGENSASDKPIDFKDKAVFVGLSEILLTERQDSFHTVFSQANGVFISGVEIAATAFSNLLEDTPVKPVSSAYYILIIFAWGFLVGAIGRLAGTIFAALAIASLSILYLIAAKYQFAGGTWYPILIPLAVQAPFGFFGAVLWSYLETNRERQRIRKALAYYIPDEVVDHLAKNIVDIKNSGQMVYGACLFADVTGYTTLSEKMSPQQLSDLMHEYFEATFEAVKKHGGLVVNLKGDSFLAIWKAARAESGLRRDACLAALDVVKAVRRFNESFANLNLPTRVGVHSGQIFLGNIGAGDHYEYGPTGDTVNTASRMDGLNKYLETEILASEEIVAQLDGLLTREVGKFLLKGKAQPIVIHELLGLLEEFDEKQKQNCAVFAEGLDAFRRQSWDEAAEKFQHAIKNSKRDGPAHFYLTLCAQYKKNPPAQPWAGIIPLEEK
jgi:adenylate cyclase